MRRRSVLIVGALLLVASPATSQLKIKKIIKVKKPYLPPTVGVEGTLTYNKSVALKFPNHRNRAAVVNGRVVRGNKDRVHLTTSNRGRSLHFTMSTKALTNAGIKVELPAVNLGSLPKGRTFSGSELAATIASQTKRTAHSMSTHDYAGMKAALEANKVVVIEAYTDKTSWRKDRRWNPVSNKSRRVQVPNVSEYSHRDGRPRGLVVTHVTDTKNSYENDRWLHRLYDPKSAQFTSGSSSTFKYPQTILRAWVIE